MKYIEQRRSLAVDQITKRNSIFNSDSGGGVYKKSRRDFFLLDYENNFFEGLRTIKGIRSNLVVEYFRRNKVSWWGGKTPTGHTLSSQIACINHLYTLRDDRDAVLTILQTINPDFIEPLKIETDSYSPSFVQFEAVSDSDHLHELTSSRGSNCTSIDALMYAKDKNEKKWLVVIEWKYVEAYSDDDKGAGTAGAVRHSRYDTLIATSKQLKNHNLNWFYYEPFYQLMRQTLWAEQMIVHNATEKLKADDYIHIHVIPPQNKELLDKLYKCSNKRMAKTWYSLINDKSKYKIIPPDILLGGLHNNQKYSNLLNYLSERYWILIQS